MGIKKEFNKIEKETLRAQASVKQRIEFWQTHTLAESLYNDGKTPRPQDIAQVSSRKLDSYGLNDCYLLANLINIARSHPKIITNGMIKIKSADEVELRFFEAVATFDKSFKPLSEEEILKATKPEDMFPRSVSFESTKKHTYTVKKEEVLKLINETHHKALWPLVIEIGFAKHILNTHHTFNALKHMAILLVTTLKTVMHINNLTTNEINELLSNQLASLSAPSPNSMTLEGIVKSAYQETGLTSITCTELTGIKSEPIKIDTKKISPGLKKFPANAKYTAEAEKIYKNIEEKLSQKRNIIASFKGLSKTTDRQAAQGFPAAIMLLPEKDVQEILKSSFSKHPCIWLQDKNYFNSNNLKALCAAYQSDPSAYDKKPYFIFAQLSEAQKLQYIHDCFKGKTLPSNLKTKTKEGIYARHAYAVVGCFEHEGYKYIVIQNPHDVKTKIDYTKSKQLYERLKSGEVKLPKDLPKGLTSRNQCMMELNHFCKYLDSLVYS